jgi:hypothetical protein
MRIIAPTVLFFAMASVACSPKFSTTDNSEEAVTGNGAFIATPSLDELARSIPARSVSPTAKQLGQAFIGGCLQPLPDISRIREAAKSLSWKDIPSEQSALMAPAAKDAEWQSWFANFANEEPYIFFVSEGGEFRGERMAICRIANPNVAAGDIVSFLTTTLQLKPPSYVWTLNVDNGRQVIISLTDGEPMQFGGINLSAMTSISDR